MHRTVRYYITESDDQPVVRTVPVAVVRTPAPERSRDEKQEPKDKSKNGRLKVKLPTPLRRAQSR